MTGLVDRNSYEYFILVIQKDVVVCLGHMGVPFEMRFDFLLKFSFRTRCRELLERGASDKNEVNLYPTIPPPQAAAL